MCNLLATTRAHFANPLAHEFVGITANFVKDIQSQLMRDVIDFRSNPQMSRQPVAKLDG